MMPRRRMAREVSVAAKTRMRRSANNGRTVRFIGRRFLKLGFVVVAVKFEKENEWMIGLRVSVSDPSFSSVKVSLGMSEGKECEENEVRFDVN